MIFLWNAEWVYMCRESQLLNLLHVFLNTLRPRQNGLHFADDILKGIFCNGNVWISINISLKSVPKG